MISCDEEDEEGEIEVVQMEGLEEFMLMFDLDGCGEVVPLDSILENKEQYHDLLELKIKDAQTVIDEVFRGQINRAAVNSPQNSSIGQTYLMFAQAQKQEIQQQMEEDALNTSLDLCRLYRLQYLIYPGPLCKAVELSTQGAYDESLETCKLALARIERHSDIENQERQQFMNVLKARFLIVMSSVYEIQSKQKAALQCLKQAKQLFQPGSVSKLALYDWMATIYVRMSDVNNLRQTIFKWQKYLTDCKIQPVEAPPLDITMLFQAIQSEREDLLCISGESSPISVLQSRDLHFDSIINPQKLPTINYSKMQTPKVPSTTKQSFQTALSTVVPSTQNSKTEFQSKSSSSYTTTTTVNFNGVRNKEVALTRHGTISLGAGLDFEEEQYVDDRLKPLDELWRRLLHWKAQLEILRGRLDLAAQYTIVAAGEQAGLETYVECLYYFLTNYTLKDRDFQPSFVRKCNSLVNIFAKDINQRGSCFSTRTLEALGRIAKLSSEDVDLHNIFFEQKLKQELDIDFDED